MIEPLKLFKESAKLSLIMSKGKLIAIGIGIAVAITVGVGLAISAQTGQTDQATITKAPEGRHFEIELKENVDVRENPVPP